MWLIKGCRPLGIRSTASLNAAHLALTAAAGCLNGIPKGCRARRGKPLDPELIANGAPICVRPPDAMAQARGQTLAKMAIAWVLRHGGITTALIGASRPEQVVDCCEAIGNPEFTKAELAQINQIAEQKDINLWAKSAGLD